MKKTEKIWPFYIYTLPPIDVFSGTFDVNEILKDPLKYFDYFEKSDRYEINEFLNEYNLIKKFMETKRNYENIVDFKVMPLLPRDGGNWMERIYLVKVDQNGTTYVFSRTQLPELEPISIDIVINPVCL